MNNDNQDCGCPVQGSHDDDDHEDHEADDHETMMVMVIMFTKAAPVKCPHDVAQTSTKTRHDGERWQTDGVVLW